ncbi:DUF1203 domain-containing protein [Brevundimonas sp.]|uniref:DUF1203 domain-containing protein n=1 Tax=Brevundimonas sp. TaxID=1871086 RepID=UPI002D25B855|nr:DUF1203 domain-containing protein [Brevundimonas sp.]HYD27349.1 DUF1203 domain-containing protein [Brevundimonas sp.]
MSFRIHGLPLSPFQPLFRMDDDALLAIGARRMIADAPHAAPCRVSLADAAPGERLILLNHRHLDAPDSPYRSEGPIFVRETAAVAAPELDEVPDMLGRRLLSIRAYDADWMMTDADVVEGRDLAGRLEVWFADPAVALIHLHTARRGCFMAAAGRG